ncbi:MAG: 3-methyl-2-oxobutanoate hydroxymethyltransferase [Acidimicrobiia bacterium]|nr:3-methyl-2-oxobutanoate hydroxymethyltransferase [Acidimicrobiia bacterium]
MGDTPKKVTAPAIAARKGGERIAMVTAYDAPSASIASEAGIDIILVGDSVANAMLGHDHTLAVDVDVMIHHTAAVARAKPHSLILGDLPWMSYHISTQEAVRNASRLIREGGAEAVKLEGGASRLPVIEAIISAEIPVMAHIGLTPQSVHSMGGYKVQGRAVADAKEMISDAIALADAGVFAMVLEGVPDTVAQVITKEVGVPTIGIGAGLHCDGQVLVWHDVLGLHDGHYAKFVRKYADLRGQAIQALQQYVADVRTETFPGEAETYHMTDEAAAALFEEEPRDLSWPLSW